MKIKKLLSLIAAAAMTVTATIGAMTASAEESVWTVADSDSSHLIGYTGTDTDIVLPTEINGVTMTSVGGFSGNTSITSVVVPEGYTSISGGSSWRGCTSLKSVSLPSTLTTISGIYNFRDCTSLTYVNIPENVTSLPSAIFSGCTNSSLLIDIKSTSITSVGSSSFKNVVGTIKVYSKDVYDLVVARATTANVVLADNTELDYSKLNEALLNASKYQETDYTADSYKALSDAVTAGNAVLSNESATQDDINNAAKVINDAIANLKLDLTTLETAIANGEKIDTSIYTEATVKTLNDAIATGKAVLTNTNATVTDVNNAVTAINEAINGLEKSYPITYDVSANSDGSVTLTLNEDGSVVVSGNGAMKNYPNDDQPWGSKGDGYYTMFKSITIEDGVTSVGDRAFWQCSNVTTLTIADSVTSIGDGAFRYCGLTGDVYVPAGITTLEDVVFADNTSADLNIYVKGAITSVGTNPFLFCTGKIYVYDANTYNLISGTNYGTFEIIYDGEVDTSELEAAIAQAEALKESDYTAATWEKLVSALESAKTELTNEDKTATSVLAATTAITNAINGLIEEGKYMAYIYSGGKQTTIASGSVINKMAGAKAIKINFDCASDISYNPNAEIDFLVNNNWDNVYEFKGTDSSYTNGKTGCSETIELSSALIKGNSITLTGYTYAWGSAADYVYAVTSVEFLDAEGKTLYTMTSATAEYEKAISALETAITKAEEIKADDYTAESYASVTEAVKAAKALTDEATVEEINAAETAINDAIKGLVKKSAPTKPEPTKPEPIKPNPSNPTTKATRSKEAVKKDKSAAKKAMKQAKITKLKVKSKAKKKINVTWKKVKKAKGYQVQVSAKKNFKKVIFKKDLKKTKLTIKNKKIKSKKTYYVRVRAYATYKNANNKVVKVYSKWNKKLRKIIVK